MACQVDLITGFLGAGKTTFIHEYLHFLRRRGERVRVIENEFGDESMDAGLLAGEDCEIGDLTGLCMCCVGKNAFIRMLRESALAGYDRIIVEPSGIYDADEFFEVLSLPELCTICAPGCILAIADPTAFQETLSPEARYLMFTQFLAAGTVILSRTDQLRPEELEAAALAIDGLMRERGCENGLPAELCTKPWSELTDDDFDDFQFSGCMRLVHEREYFEHMEVFRSEPLIAHYSDVGELRARIRAVFSDAACGKVYRIKGYAFGYEGAEPRCCEVNAVPAAVSIASSDRKEGLLVVIGEALSRRELRARLCEKDLQING